MSSKTPTPRLDSDDSIKALGPMTRLVGLLLRGDVALMLTALSLIAGMAALWLTPREEEPQIVVPMADILIEAPGISAAEVERQVTEKLRKTGVTNRRCRIRLFGLALRAKRRHGPVLRG